jgi:suppressor of G2 allele of SKP1
MSTQAGLGQAALQNRDYPVAIKHLTDALKSSQSPLWLIQRSTAYQRLGEHTLALTDANNAVLAAINRARREQIAAAQFRRGVALYGLKRYGDARMCFNWCRKANEKEPGLGMWQAKVKADYEKLGEEAEENKITITEIPDKVEDVKHTKQAEQVATEPPATNLASDLFSAVAATPLAPIQTPKEKIRHEWFQSSSKVTITIFAKGVPKDQAEVIFEPGTVSALSSCALLQAYY